MYKNLCEEFKRYEDQPVRVYTDDERVIEGIVICPGENFVRILARCGDVFVVEYPHIASIEEPQMRLRARCACMERCRNNGCDNGCDDNDYERGNGSGSDYGYGNGDYKRNC